MVWYYRVYCTRIKYMTLSQLLCLLQFFDNQQLYFQVNLEKSLHNLFFINNIFINFCGHHLYPQMENLYTQRVQQSYTRMLSHRSHTIIQKSQKFWILLDPSQYRTQQNVRFSRCFQKSFINQWIIENARQINFGVFWRSWDNVYSEKVYYLCISHYQGHMSLTDCHISSYGQVEIIKFGQQVHWSPQATPSNMLVMSLLCGHLTLKTFVVKEMDWLPQGHHQIGTAIQFLERSPSGTPQLLMLSLLFGHTTLKIFLSLVMNRVQ